jgi:hypothetical protein
VNLQAPGQRDALANRCCAGRGAPVGQRRAKFLCAECGGDAVIHDIVPDDPGRILEAVRSGVAAGYDLLLLIAGSSAGSRDHAPTVLSEAVGIVGRGGWERRRLTHNRRQSALFICLYTTDPMAGGFMLILL